MTYIVARNGQHLSGNYKTQLEARQRIEKETQLDEQDAKAGWITNEQWKNTRYDILKRK